jgi:predicted Rossmann-fold nucleotide-binding protein
VRDKRTDKRGEKSPPDKEEEDRDRLFKVLDFAEANRLFVSMSDFSVLVLGNYETEDRMQIFILLSL